MGSAFKEMTLQGALSDPLIRTLMAADKVDPAQLESMLRRIAKDVAPRRLQPKDSACGCLA